MAEKLTVTEASAAYGSAMRNIVPAGPGICNVCHTFIDASYDRCFPCARGPNEFDVVVPITYSEHLGQLHTALRNYKDGLPSVQRYAMVRLAAILWRFLDAHEACVAAAAGVDEFDLVTTVPSSDPERDDRRANLRTIVGWCQPVNAHWRRVLRATGSATTGRAFDRERYEATESLLGSGVLLIDDTWTRGGHAQSAAAALRAAGAARVALVVIGRHVRPDWEVRPGESCGDRLEALPKVFDWSTCAVH